MEAIALPNVFITPDRIEGDRLRIDGSDAGHLLRVLRLGPGDLFTALDGTGLEYEAEIVGVNGKRIEARIKTRRRRRTEPRLRLTIGQALPKGDKMEQAIRKCTELGAAAFWPLLTERCVPSLPAGRAGDRLARWRKIAAEAACQSGRAVIPEVAGPRSWSEAAERYRDFDLTLLPWEGETERTLKDALNALEEPEQVLVLIGPEGGLARAEVEAARRAGAVTVTLGPRILRTETAGLVVGAALFYHYDEMSFAR